MCAGLLCVGAVLVEEEERCEAAKVKDDKYLVGEIHLEAASGLRSRRWRTTYLATKQVPRWLVELLSVRLVCIVGAPSSDNVSRGEVTATADKAPQKH